MRWGGTCSANGVPLTVRTPGDAQSEPCCPSCRKSWSVGCPLHPYRFTWLLFHPPRPHRGEIGREAWSGHQVLRGARRLNPPRPSSLPSLDFVLVLRALQTAQIEPLQSVELKFLSLKTLLLTTLASIKWVGDLQAFSVDESCLEFGPADSSATLSPSPAKGSYHSLKG